MADPLIIGLNAAVYGGVAGGTAGLLGTAPMCP
jgi:hypothetical protein